MTYRKRRQPIYHYEANYPQISPASWLDSVIFYPKIKYPNIVNNPARTVNMSKETEKVGLNDPSRFLFSSFSEKFEFSFIALFIIENFKISWFYIHPLANTDKINI